MITKATYEGHDGYLSTRTGEMWFYDIHFSGILEARKFLNGVPPDEYTPFEYNYSYGLLCNRNGWCYYMNTWYFDTETLMDAYPENK